LGRVEGDVEMEKSGVGRGRCGGEGDKRGVDKGRCVGGYTEGDARLRGRQCSAVREIKRLGSYSAVREIKSLGRW